MLQNVNVNSHVTMKKTQDDTEYCRLKSNQAIYPSGGMYHQKLLPKRDVEKHAC